MATEVTVKRWGNSMGIVLPKDLVEKMDIKENVNIMIDIVKESDISNLFGTLTRKMSGQSFKDMVRDGWK